MQFRRSQPRFNQSDDEDEGSIQQFPIINPRHCSLFFHPNIQSDGQSMYQTKPMNATLRKLSYKVSIINNIMKTTVHQTFKNSTLDKLCNAKYYFKVEEGVCLESFLAKYGENEVKAIVKAKVDAQREFIEAKSAGQVVSYAETQKNQHDDFLVIQLENIPPQSEVEITLSFSSQLQTALNKYFVVSIPLQFVEDSEAVAENKDVLSLELLCTGRVTYAESRGYPIEKESIDESSINMRLKYMYLQKDTPFSLIFAYEGMFTPQVIFGASKHYEPDQVKQAIAPRRESAMISFLPNFNSKITPDIDDAVRNAIESGKDIQDDAFLARINDELVNFLDSSRSEFIFLLDRSGSMSGRPIEKAKSGLILFLKSLPNDSYFNVISFGTETEQLFPKSQKYTSDSLASAIQEIENFRADLGGTEVYYPLKKLVFNEKKIHGYNKQIFLLTDGAVNNPQRVIELIKKNNRFNQVHSIGFGKSADKYLIEESARAGRGVSEFIRMNQDLSDLIISLLGRSISPSLDEFKIKYDKSVVESVYPNLKQMPCVFKNQLFNFHIFFKPLVDISALSEEQKTITVSYVDSTKSKPNQPPVEQKFELKLEGTDVFASHQELKESVFRFAKQLQLIDAFEQNPNQDLKKKLTDQAVDFQLLTKNTAMICKMGDLNDVEKAQFEQVLNNSGFQSNIFNQQPQFQNQNNYRGGFNPGQPNNFNNNTNSQPTFYSSSQQQQQQFGAARNPFSRPKFSAPQAIQQAPMNTGFSSPWFQQAQSSQQSMNQGSPPMQNAFQPPMQQQARQQQSMYIGSPPPPMQMACQPMQQQAGSQQSSMKQRSPQMQNACQPEQQSTYSQYSMNQGSQQMQQQQMQEQAQLQQEEIYQREQMQKLQQQMQQQAILQQEYINLREQTQQGQQRKQHMIDIDMPIESAINPSLLKAVEKNSVQLWKQSTTTCQPQNQQNGNPNMFNNTFGSNNSQTSVTNPNTFNDWLSTVDFQGVWQFNQESLLASESGLSETVLDELKKAFKTTDALMTLIVICILELRYINEKKKWNIIVKKSFSYVQDNLNEDQDIISIKKSILDALLSK